MSNELMNTKEVSEYLSIHEKQVYALIKAKKIPCTRVTGKWVFPKEAIDDWIKSTTENPIETHSLLTKEFILASGSNDPVLEILLSYMKATHRDLHLFSSSTGSSEGLRLLKENMTDIAWCHLFDFETGTYNVPVIESMFKDKEITVVHLFFRNLGFIYSPELTSGIHKFSNIKDKSLTFVNRQEGSGTRIMIDHNLEKENLDPHDIDGYKNEVYTHFEVGLSIKGNNADVGIATVAVANLFGLPFTPLIEESFDMVMHQSTFFKKEVQAFIDTLQSDNFREKVAPLGNYDFTNSGKILFSTKE